MEHSQTAEQLKLKNQLCFPLYACARKVVNSYTPYLKPLGITYTQYLVFMVLWEEDGQKVGDVCKKLYLDSGTLTPLLKKMEEAGWLRRTRCAQDERVVILHLTQKGQDLKFQAAQIPFQAGNCVHLSPEEAQVLYGLLYRILE